MPATLSFQKMLSARSPGTSQHVLDLTAGQGSTSLLEKTDASHMVASSMDFSLG